MAIPKKDRGEAYRTKNNLLNEFISYMSMNGALKNTLKTYGQITNRFIAWYEGKSGTEFDKETVSLITPPTMVEYYSSIQDLSIATRNITVQALRTAFAFFKDMGYIQNDPCTPLRLQRQRREKYEPNPNEAPQNMITSDEAIKLLKHKSSYNGLRNRAIIALILGTGLRVFEVSELTIGSIRGMQNGMMYCHRKGDIWRYVPMPKPALGYIIDYLETRGGINSENLKDSDPLFEAQTGGFMTVRTIQHSINAIQKDLGMKTGVHMLRHTALTGVQRSGGVAVARDVASHTNVDVTNRYLHSTPEERIKAAEQLPWFNTIKN